MPEVEDKTRRDEEYREEEEEKKFPVWIIPLVAGPVLLIVLIVALAGSRPGPDGGTPVEVFNEPKLKKEADDLLMNASKFYHEAMRLQNQKQRDEILDKAGPACDAAIQKLYKIQDYYEEHDIRGKWDWEKTLQEASQLAYDIQKAHGF